MGKQMFFLFFFSPWPGERNGTRMKPEVKRYTAEVGGKTITFETGKLAAQAGGAVTIQLGESVVFSAATMGDEVHEEQDFFPLTVEYEERMYAGGRIPGSFFRREGRPAGDTILIGRLVDRPIRPLFSQDIETKFRLSSIASPPILKINWIFWRSMPLRHLWLSRISHGTDRSVPSVSD